MDWAGSQAHGHPLRVSHIVVLRDFKHSGRHWHAHVTSRSIIRLQHATLIGRVL